MKFRITRYRSKFHWIFVVVFSLSALAPPWVNDVGAQTVITAEFDYSMPARFDGVDGDGDGLIDYFTTREQINPPGGWQVDFDACSSKGSQLAYILSVNNMPPEVYRRCNFSYKFKQEGTYQVTLKVQDNLDHTATTTKTVIVQDWLIIGLGDSYASGEGNPEIPIAEDFYIDNNLRPSAKARWQQPENCHRSAYSGQAQAAIQLEQADPRTSVTFVHLACSGNTIENLIKDGGQLDQAKDLIGDRVVDAIVISIGGNDINFSSIVKACMWQKNCHVNADSDLGLESIKNTACSFPTVLDELFRTNIRDKCLKAYDGFIKDTPNSAKDYFESGEKTLADKYHKLNNELKEFLDIDSGDQLPYDKVFITEYPDITRDDFGNICEPPYLGLPGWSRAEGKWASEFVLSRLNKKIKAAAAKYNWVYVDDISNSFKPHGYCAVGGWVVSLEETFLIQGDQNGVVHPNRDGHNNYAQKINIKLTQHLYVGGSLDHPKQIPLAIIHRLDRLNEGSSYELKNLTINPNGSDTPIQYTWSLLVEPPGSAELSNTKIALPNLKAVDGYATGELTLTAKNSSGSQTSTVPFIVYNVPPTVNAGADQTVNETDIVNLKGSFTDQGINDNHSFNWKMVSSTNIQEVEIDSRQTPNFNFIPADDGVYIFQLDVRDDDEGVGSDQVIVTVTNVPPKATLQSSGTSIAEGDLVEVEFTDAQDSLADMEAGLHYAFECNGRSLATATYASSGAASSTNCTYADNGSYTVRAKIMDKDGGSTEYTKTIIIHNAPPSVSAGLDQRVSEGQPVGLNGTFSDPGKADSHKFQWRLVSSTNGQWVPGGNGPDFNFTPIDNGTYTFELSVTDDDGGAGTDTVEVIVDNAAPAITANSPTIYENQFASLSGTITDPGSQDDFTLEVDWGDGERESGSLPPGSTRYALSHLYIDDDPTTTPSDVYALQVTLRDKDGGEAVANPTVTVQNVEPVVQFGNLRDETGRIIGIYDVVPAWIQVEIAEKYSDAGPSDTRTAVRRWGDGSPEENLGEVLDETSGSHIYSHPGIYELFLTVTDDDAGVYTVSRIIIVVTPSSVIREVIHSTDGDVATNNRARSSIIAALEALEGQGSALDMYERGNFREALRLIELSIHKFKQAENRDSSLDFSSQKVRLALAAKSILSEAIAQAEAKPNGRAKRELVQQAKSLLEQGQHFLSVEYYLRALERFRKALNIIQGR